MADPHSIVSHIGDLAQSGERMIERLRRKAFLPESRKGLNVRFGIAEAAQLLGCSTNRIRMAEDDEHEVQEGANIILSFKEFTKVVADFEGGSCVGLVDD